MDKEIIKRFRDEVNAQDLVLQMYRNYAGKNYWNIICSAMDWIDVVRNDRHKKRFQEKR